MDDDLVLPSDVLRSGVRRKAISPPSTLFAPLETLLPLVGCRPKKDDSPFLLSPLSLRSIGVGGALALFSSPAFFPNVIQRRGLPGDMPLSVSSCGGFGND